MNPKYLIVGLVISFCISIIILTLYLSTLNKSNESSITSPQLQLFELSGEGQYWSVDNYKVLKTSKIIKRTSARLTYNNDVSDIDQSNYLKVEIVEDNKIVYTTVKSSNFGPISILTNIDNLGSIENELSKFDQKINKDKVEQTKVIITWNDSNGKTCEETIELKIFEELIA